jgi:hypothetical protein
LQHGGHIDLSAIPPIECVAAASDQHAMLRGIAAPIRRIAHGLELLTRLDSSPDYCFKNEEFIDKVNTPPPSTRWSPDDLTALA